MTTFFIGLIIVGLAVITAIAIIGINHAAILAIGFILVSAALANYITKG